MSLALNRERLSAAVSGELSREEDAELRRHLAGCDECRAGYDALIVTARALRGSTEPTTTEVQRDFDRLLTALEPPAPHEPARSRLWWAPFLVTATAALAVLLVAAPPAEPQPEVQLRGGPGESKLTLSLRVYAKPKAGGPARVVADFPGSGEAHASAAEWLQLKSSTSQDAGVVTVIGVRDGEVTVFDGARSTELTPGRWRLFAVAAPEAEVMAAATQRSPPRQDDRLPLAAEQATGVLWVDP